MPTAHDLQSTTLQVLNKRITDQLYRKTPFISQAQANGLIERIAGGQRVENPVLLAEHGEIIQLSNGNEKTPFNVKDPTRLSKHEWADFVGTVAITHKEKTRNKGPQAQNRIYEIRLKSMRQMLMKEVEKQLIAASSTILTDLETMNGFGTRTEGWFENAAYGSQTNVVGTLSKATYSESWQNQLVDVAGNFAANGETKMAEGVVQTQLYAPEGDIDIIHASPASYLRYKESLRDDERYMAAKEFRLDGGKLALDFSGVPLVVNPNLGFTVAGGSDKVSMYMLNSALLRLYFDTEGEWELGALREMEGQFAYGARLFVAMQMAPYHLAGHCVVINAEA